MNEHRIIDETGKRYSMLTVLGMAPDRIHGMVSWHCVCDCGNQRMVQGDHLRIGKTRSCGCANGYRFGRFGKDGRNGHVYKQVTGDVKKTRRQCNQERAAEIARAYQEEMK